MEKVKCKLHFDNFCCIEAIGTAGGLCLFWQKDVDLCITYKDKNMIVAIIFNFADKPWLVALCDAPAYNSRKALFWNILQATVEAFDGSWLYLGDFNNILGQWEKMGGNTGDTSNKFLSEFMLNTGAIDLGFNGNKYTWSNKRWGKSCIKERLDRGMCNDNWRMIFPQAVI